MYTGPVTMKTYRGVMNLAKRMKDSHASLAMDSFLKAPRMLSQLACDGDNKPAAAVCYTKPDGRVLVHMVVGNLYYALVLVKGLESEGPLSTIALLPEQVDLADALRSNGWTCTAWCRERHPEIMLYRRK